MNVKERASKTIKEIEEYEQMAVSYISYMEYEIVLNVHKNEDLEKKFSEFYRERLYTLPSIRRKLQTCEKSDMYFLVAQMERNHEQIAELKNVLAMFSFIKVMCENIANKTDEEAESARDLFEQINTMFKTITLNCPLI